MEADKLNKLGPDHFLADVTLNSLRPLMGKVHQAACWAEVVSLGSTDGSRMPECCSVS